MRRLSSLLGILFALASFSTASVEAIGPVVVATTTNVSTAGLRPIDGIEIRDGDRVLMKNQTRPADNGVYVARAGDWRRAPDALSSNDLRTGVSVFVSGGTTNGARVFFLSTVGRISVGVTPQTWTEVLTPQHELLRAYGGTATSDIAPTPAYLVGQSAYPQATTNTTGSNVNLAGGLGRRIITVLDYSAGIDDAITFSISDGVNGGAGGTIVEGVHFAAVTSNAVTASNIASAVNGWIPGATATAEGAVVYLTKTSTSIAMVIGSEDPLAYAPTSGTDGKVKVTGAFQVTGSTVLEGAVELRSSLRGVPLALSPCDDPPTKYCVDGRFEASVSSAVPITITSIDGGLPGQILLLSFEDSNVTISDSGALRLAGDFTSSADDVLLLFYTGAVWREISRSVN